MMAIMVCLFLFVLSVQSAPAPLAATSKTFAVPYASAGQSKTDQRDPQRNVQFGSLLKEVDVFTKCEKRTHEAFARFTDGSISIKASNLKELLDQSKTKDVTLAAKEAKDYQECEQRMRDAFARFTDGSNSIKADELKELLDQYYKANNLTVSDDVLDKIIHYVDADKSQDINFDEFAISDKYKKKQLNDGYSYSFNESTT